jgi:hypothetical protein
VPILSCWSTRIAKDSKYLARQRELPFFAGAY